MSWVHADDFRAVCVMPLLGELSAITLDSTLSTLFVRLLIWCREQSTANTSLLFFLRF